jgi:ligand-binding SRPBCC domain-containing protein
MKTYQLRSELWAPHPPQKIFPFFSDAFNLDAITPQWLHFQILTPPPICMKKGTLIDYKLRLHGIPIQWKTEIVEWNPPFRFVDRQRKGPYRKWIHTHLFEKDKGGTRMVDLIEYSLWPPIASSLLNRILVESDLKKIFAYRREKLAMVFGDMLNEAGRVQ